MSEAVFNAEPVSYTHLDVYKRQVFALFDFIPHFLQTAQQFVKIFHLGNEGIYRRFQLGLDVYKRQTFADTGAEHPHTYQFIEIINQWLAEHGMPQITVVQYVEDVYKRQALHGGTGNGASAMSALNGKRKTR